MNQSPKDPINVKETKIDYKSLYKFNTDAIVTINKSGQIYDGNQAVEQLGGYKLEELLNTNFLDYVIEEDKQDAYNCFQLAINGTSKESKFIFVGKSGVHIPCIVKFITMEVDHIDIGLFLVLKDARTFEYLTSRFRASEMNFKIIAENVQDVIILMDDQKNYLYVSPSSKMMFGFDPDKINSKQEPFFNIHPDDVALLESSFNSAIIEGKPYNVTLKAFHEEKGWIWTEIMGTPVFDVNRQFSHMVLVARDISVYKENEEKLTYFAFHDALTGIPNRRFFENRLTESITRLNTEGQPFTLILFDIDDFKLINDHWGHEVGDLVIKEFATRIQKIISQEGIVARLGGDEFVAILNNIHTETGVGAFIQNIKTETLKEIIINNQSIHITTSIGATICTEKDMDGSYFFNNADAALYNVKEKGKNKYHINYS